jgi:hypothetical protein
VGGVALSCLSRAAWRLGEPHSAGAGTALLTLRTPAQVGEFSIGNAPLSPGFQIDRPLFDAGPAALRSRRRAILPTVERLTPVSARPTPVCPDRPALQGAMPAGRKTPALDHGDLMGDVRMQGIVGDRIDAGLRHDLAGLNSCATAGLREHTYRRFVKRSSTMPCLGRRSSRRGQPRITPGPFRACFPSRLMTPAPADRQQVVSPGRRRAGPLADYSNVKRARK